jgi:hypothetical protein
MLKTNPERNGGLESSKLQRTRRILLIAGFALLALWAVIWAISLREDRLVIGNYTYIPCVPHLGCDFDINYCTTHIWMAGGDPYRCIITGFPYKYEHPPLVLLLFSWCTLIPHNIAGILWFSVQAVVFSLAVLACWRSRNELDLFPIPLPLLLAAILLSFPVLFEMERGNWNVLVLLFLILSAAALRGRSLWCDILAGAFAGLAAWIKIYPALFLLGLLALRRWRAAGFFAAAVLVIGLADVRGTMAFAENIKESAKSITPDFEGSFIPWSHTVSGSWLLFCGNIHQKWLEHLPKTVGWGLLVFPLVLWVSYWIAKVPNPSRLLYPYFLWLIASATYLPPIANDYSLFFLPLAALAVWDRRDKVFVHVLMVLMLIWWQPIWPPLSGKFYHYAKLLSLGSVALILVIRAWDQIGAGRRSESSLLLQEIPSAPRDPSGVVA